MVVFAALLVFVNYCAVTTFFPALVLVYDSHVAQCLPCLSRAGAACKGGLRRCWARVRRKDPDAVKGELFEKSGEAEAPFFQAKFAPFIFRWKRVIIFLLVSLWVVGVAFAAMLLAVRKSKFYGVFVLNRRVDLHAIDATPAR